MFYEFKVGEERYAYPFALGMYEALRRQDLLLDFDAIIPIPLSPDKVAAGEFHRTKALAEELEALLDVPVREYLALAEPISKRRFCAGGAHTRSQFEATYGRLLNVDGAVRGLSSVLLIDDVELNR